jgi:hypothetical protein
MPCDDAARHYTMLGAHDVMHDTLVIVRAIDEHHVRFAMPLIQPTAKDAHISVHIGRMVSHHGVKGEPKTPICIDGLLMLYSARPSA